jgi:site-specific recombinase XerD
LFSVLCQKKHIPVGGLRAVVSSSDSQTVSAAHAAACREFPSLLRLQEALVLDTCSTTKREEYLRYGLRIAQWAKADPATLSEDRVRAFFLEIKREGRYAPNTIRLMTAALRYLFVKVLQREVWQVFKLIHSPDVKRLPIVLNVAQVHALLEHTRLPHFRLLWELILGTGLRISEAVSLEVTAIHGRGEPVQSLRVIGKGNKERCIPLPPSLYQKLQAWWSTHRHPRRVFPSMQDQRRLRQSGVDRASEGHLTTSAAQYAMNVIRQEAGLPEATTCHTLRHTYATMSLEAGVNLLQVSRYLGHESLETTQIYLHLTTTSELRAVTAVEGNMQRLYKPTAAASATAAANKEHRRANPSAASA